MVEFEGCLHCCGPVIGEKDFGEFGLPLEGSLGTSVGCVSRLEFGEFDEFGTQV